MIETGVRMGGRSQRRPTSASQEGAIPLEWLAVAAVTVVVFGALVVATGGERLAHAVASGYCRVVSTIADVDCGLGDPGGPGGSELVTVTCLDSRTTEAAGGNVTLFSVRADGGIGYQLDRNSNGTYEVTLEMSGGLAAELVAGGSIDADALGFKAGKEGAVRAGANASVSPVYSFGSRQEAEAFAEAARDLVAGPIDDVFDWRTLIPVYGTARIPYNQMRRARDFDPPPPSRIAIDGGIELAAEGSLRGGGAGADGLLSLGTTLGGEHDLETGNTTINVALDGEVAAELGLSVVPPPVAAGPGASGGVSQEVVVSLTVGPDLRPVELGVATSVLAQHGVTGFGELELEGMMSGFDVQQLALEGGINQHDAALLTGSATVDLTDPALGPMGQDLLAALGGADPAAMGAATRQLGQHLQHETDLQVQLHTGDLTSSSLGARGGKGLAFGAGVSYDSSDIAYAAGWHRPAGGNFGPAVCG